MNNHTSFKQQFDINFAHSIQTWAEHLDANQLTSLSALINPRKVKAKRLPCPDNLHFGCSFPFTVGSLQVLQEIASMSQPKILDVACGYGYFSYLAAIAGADVTGVDINDIALDEARSYAQKFAQYTRGNLQFIYMDIFQSESLEQYDLIHCRKFMHFLPPAMQITLLQKLYAMLRPGGVLHISANSIYSGEKKRRDLAIQRFESGAPSPGYIAFSRTNHAIKCKGLGEDEILEPGVLYGTGASQIYMTNMLDHQTFANHLARAEIPIDCATMHYETWNIYAPEIIDAHQVRSDTPYNLMVRITKV